MYFFPHSFLASNEWDFAEGESTLTFQPRMKTEREFDPKILFDARFGEDSRLVFTGYYIHDTSLKMVIDLEFSNSVADAEIEKAEAFIREKADFNLIPKRSQETDYLVLQDFFNPALRDNRGIEESNASI